MDRDRRPLSRDDARRVAEYALYLWGDEVRTGVSAVGESRALLVEAVRPTTRGSGAIARLAGHLYALRLQPDEFSDPEVPEEAGRRAYRLRRLREALIDEASSAIQEAAFETPIELIAEARLRVQGEHRRGRSRSRISALSA